MVCDTPTLLFLWPLIDTHGKNNHQWSHILQYFTYFLSFLLWRGSFLYVHNLRSKGILTACIIYQLFTCITTEDDRFYLIISETVWSYFLDGRESDTWSAWSLRAAKWKGWTLSQYGDPRTWPDLTDWDAVLWWVRAIAFGGKSHQGGIVETLLLMCRTVYWWSVYSSHLLAWSFFATLLPHQIITVRMNVWSDRRLRSSPVRKESNHRHRSQYHGR